MSIQARYVFWAIASCLIAGCVSEPKTLLIYRPEALDGEIAPGPALLPLFGSPQVASSPYGVDEAAGISLNSRSQVQATAGYYDQGDDVRYGLRYRDRQGDYGHFHGYRGHGGGYGGGYFNRTFHYSSRGGWSR